MVVAVATAVDTPVVVEAEESEDTMTTAVPIDAMVTVEEEDEIDTTTAMIAPAVATLFPCAPVEEEWMNDAVLEAMIDVVPEATIDAEVTSEGTSEGTKRGEDRLPVVRGDTRRDLPEDTASRDDTRYLVSLSLAQQHSELTLPCRPLFPFPSFSPSPLMSFSDTA